jgi:AcrR family transcriptional regulator
VQARSRKKYDAVLKACTHVLTECGYRATTMMEFSLSSGVAVPTIYQYFDNKEDIVLAWFEGIVEQVLTSSLAMTGDLDDETLESQIEPIIAHALELIASYRPTIRGVFSDLPSMMSSKFVSSMERSTVAFAKSLKTSSMLSQEQALLDRRIVMLVRCVLGYVISSVFSEEPIPELDDEVEDLSLMIKSYLKGCEILPAHDTG